LANGVLFETSFISSGKFIEVIPHLTTGVHELPQNPGQGDKFHEMRWSMCVAFYFAMGMAGKLIDAVDNTTNKHVFKSPDVFLHAFTQLWLWPL